MFLSSHFPSLSNFGDTASYQPGAEQEEFDFCLQREPQKGKHLTLPCKNTHVHIIVLIIVYIWLGLYSIEFYWLRNWFFCRHNLCILS